MIPKVITEGSTIKCAHQGTVKFTASQQLLKVNKQAVLVVADISSGVITGCTTVPDSSGSKKCTKVVSLTAGTATKLQVDNELVLLETAQGLTDGVTKPPSNTWSVQSAEQTKLSTI